MGRAGIPCRRLQSQEYGQDEIQADHISKYGASEKCAGEKERLSFNGKEITEMDESQAFHELHPGAVYLHDSEQYEC